MWEHIVVTRPMLVRQQPSMRPYIHIYTGQLTQPRLGKLEHWRRFLDDVDVITWKPYLYCEHWDDDDTEMPYLYQSMFLIGKTFFFY